MYTIVLIIQYTSIVALFIEGWVVFRKWNSKLHAYLFFSIISNLVSNVGYLFELKAIPHKDSAADAPPIFSSECAKRAQLT